MISASVRFRHLKPRGNWAAIVRIPCVLALAFHLIGCSAVIQAEGIRTTDQSAVEAAATRSAIEKKLGTPVQHEQFESGHLVVYKYDLGKEPFSGGGGGGWSCYHGTGCAAVAAVVLAGVILAQPYLMHKLYADQEGMAALVYDGDDRLRYACWGGKISDLDAWIAALKVTSPYCGHLTREAALRAAQLRQLAAAGNVNAAVELAKINEDIEPLKSMAYAGDLDAALRYAELSKDTEPLQHHVDAGEVEAATQYGKIEKDYQPLRRLAENADVVAAKKYAVLTADMIPLHNLAERGNIDAQYQYYQMIWNDMRLGSFSEAWNMLCAAAREGHIDAQAEVAYRHWSPTWQFAWPKLKRLSAIGLKPDDLVAYAWFERATQLGSAKAAERLQQLKMDLSADKLLEAKKYADQTVRPSCEVMVAHDEEPMSRAVASVPETPIGANVGSHQAPPASRYNNVAHLRTYLDTQQKDFLKKLTHYEFEKGVVVGGGNDERLPKKLERYWVVGPKNRGLEVGLEILYIRNYTSSYTKIRRILKEHPVPGSALGYTYEIIG